ncbi:MAG TPA: endolytic transglycosylase MltG [Bacteroidales bacterium]|nr:endolytic transglycosylase MltG [Bacteroidales bacterium]
MIGVIVGGFVIISGYFAYLFVFKPNVKTENEFIHFHIPTGSTYQQVKELLTANEILKNQITFNWVAQRKNYPAHVRPGRYLLRRGMSNNSLVNLLRSGRQDPVNVTFNNIRTREQLAGVITRNLEADSASVLALMNNEEKMQSYGLNRETAKLLFIPNTYEFFWNTSPEQLLDRMYREYRAFWNESRKKQAEKTGMSPVEVSILASIIRLETNKRDEMPRIAGVYINRLRRNIPLQADPTVIFAIGDFSIRRVLYRHLAYDSPYNTYKYPGLPPGPISLPEPYVIDAVLNYEPHEYLFFSAHYDFSGYHVFARTYREHRENARRYQNVLNQLNVMR